MRFQICFFEREGRAKLAFNDFGIAAVARKGEHDAGGHVIAPASENGDSVRCDHVNGASRERDIEIGENDAGNVVKVD